MMSPRGHNHPNFFQEILLGILEGHSVEEIVDRALRSLSSCWACREGLPLDGHDHILPYGLRVPCEDTPGPQVPRPRARKYHHNPKGRGIARRQS